MNDSPRSYAGIRVLVTGATGFIGRWVARALVAEGAKLAVVLRSPRRLEGFVAEKATIFERDVARQGELASAICEFRPSIVFNLAGYGVRKTERDEVAARHVNMHAVGEAIEALAGELDETWGGSRIVQTGSALEYGAIDELLDENVQPLPATTYGQTKLAATTILCHARDEGRLPSITARLFTVFGPGEREGRLFPTLVEGARGSGRIPLSTGTQQRDFVYVGDVARGLLDLGRVPAETVLGGLHPFDAPAINFACGNLTPVREFVAAASKVLGIPEARLGFGDLPQLPEELFHGPVPVARLRAALGWLPPADPASGLQRAAAALTQ